jgi:hypothetical protein
VGYICTVRAPLDELLAATPRWRRPAMRAVLALARRPRGLALLARMSPADQAAAGIVAMGRYDEEAVATSLGWDAEAVARRGRELRRAEGRP